MTARTITLANRHPRLRLDRRGVLKVIRLLDAEFSKSPSKSPSGARSPSKIENQKSKIPSVSAVPPGELSLVFLTDPALAQLHADFLDDPTTTDVITFEGLPALGTAGEICVSADTAAAYAKKHGRDFSAELTLYVIHGWLHLAGYDDLQPAKKRIMRRAEARAMAILQAHGCLPRFTLTAAKRR